MCVYVCMCEWVCISCEWKEKNVHISTDICLKEHQTLNAQKHSDNAHTHTHTHLQWEAIARWILVKVVQIYVVNDWLIEHWEIHLLCQFGCQCSFPCTCMRERERERE